MTTVETLSFESSHAVDRLRRGSLRTPQPASSGDLVSLAMGEPGFETPPGIRLTAHAAIEAGYTHYAHPHGDNELRDALAQHLTTHSLADVTAEDVLITHGGTGGLAAAILAIVDPGDTVVLPDPTYSLYADLVHLAGGRCLSVPLQADLHWDLDALSDALRDAKMFVFCNPSNPTGIVHAAAELNALAAMVAGTGTLVLADEAYRDLVYTEVPFVSALDVADLVPRTLYCQTYSKAYAMTGWRVGYLAGPREVVAAAARVHATIIGSLNPATQRAALTALVDGSANVVEMREQYRSRRDLMVDGLTGIKGLHLAPPDGAFYAFPRYEHDIAAVDIVAHLRNHGVAVRPGSEFGRAGERHIRLSFAAEPAAIKTGAERVRTGLAHLEHLLPEAHS